MWFVCMVCIGLCFLLFLLFVYVCCRDLNIVVLCGCAYLVVLFYGVSLCLYCLLYRLRIVFMLCVYLVCVVLIVFIVLYFSRLYIVLMGFVNLVCDDLFILFCICVNRLYMVVDVACSSGLCCFSLFGTVSIEIVHCVYVVVYLVCTVLLFSLFCIVFI